MILHLETAAFPHQGKTSPRALPNTVLANPARSRNDPTHCPMPTDNSPIWQLKKFGAGEVHGPVSFEKLREWADAAQINPQDSVSSDGKTWTKAPMIAELQMDWLVEVPDNPLYGPTTSGALLEFLRMGEINPDTHVVNCCTGESLVISDAPFYQSDDPETLAARIEELEAELLAARETIDQLRARLAEFETAS
jgi:hypothetical protein